MNIWKVIFDVKIHKTDWPVLRDIYGLHWPRHILSFNTINNYIKWTAKNPKMDVIIFTSDFDWESHGTFVLVEQIGTQCKVFVNTLKPKENQELLLKAFKCLLLDRPFTLAAFSYEVQPIVENFLSNESLRKENTCEKLLFYLPMPKSLELLKTEKPGYFFKSLSLYEIPIIVRLLKDRYSDLYIGDIIRNNLTLGVYEEKFGTLCGWIMQEPWGTMGMIHILDSFKKNGLGEQLIVRMAILYANAGLDATATFRAIARCHRDLFHKLGFRIINKVFWYYVIPPQHLRLHGKKDLGSEVLSTLRKSVDTCNS